MLKPISKWIKADSGPFLVVILCSVSHDPYEVPEWFAAPARKPFERYLQTIHYTDKFLEALDKELAGLNLSDNTIYCVIGDHGEAFGEHGLSGHQRIAFEETLRIPWVMRAPSLLEGQRRITEPVSSIDLTPTLLGLLGFDTRSAHFDGIDALGVIPDNRKVYFADWMHEGPAGFVQGKEKFIYNPTTKTVSKYDLSADPCELNRTELQQQQGQEIAEEIFAWRKNSIFRLDEPYVERKILFDSYLCYRRANRVWRAKYQPNAQN
jgi:arylsulfatase A-like enzyme